MIKAYKPHTEAFLERKLVSWTNEDNVLQQF